MIFDSILTFRHPFPFCISIRLAVSSLAIVAAPPCPPTSPAVYANASATEFNVRVRSFAFRASHADTPTYV